MANTTKSRTFDSKIKKYATLLTLVLLFLALTVGLLGLNFYSTNKYASFTQRLDNANRQGATSQQLSKNLLDINLYINTALQTPQAQPATATAISATASSPMSASAVAPTPTTATPTVATTAPATATTPSAVASAPTAMALANTDNQTVSLDQLPQTAIYKIDEIKKQRDNFEQVLSAFQQGGDVTLPSGETIHIDATTEPDALKSLQNTQQVWTPYLGLLDNFIKDTQKGYLSKQTSDYLVDYSRLYNQALLTESNNLSTALNKEITRQTTLQKYIQLFGIVGAFLLFFGIVFGALRQLLKGDAQLLVARKQTQDILGTVNEGLFLIDKDLVISDEYSASLETIVNQKNLAGTTLLQLLSDKVSAQDLDTTKLFVEQLYNSWVVEDLIKDLNPLKQVLVSYVDDKGTSVTKFLSFDFLRVLDDKGEVSKVFVSVVDVTQAIRLQENLEKARQQHDRELEMISTILSVDHQHLFNFIDSTNRRIDNMNNILKAETAGGQETLHSKITQLLREAHSLKGDASAIKLTAFVGLAEKLETQLKALAMSHNLTGNDFLGFTVNLKELLDLNQFIQSLLQRLNMVGKGVQQSQLQSATAKPVPVQPVQTSEPVSSPMAMQAQPAQAVSQTQQSPVWQTYFSNYAHDIAQRQGKQINIICEGFDDPALHTPAFNDIKDITIQLLKNAIVHGIETPDVRQAQHKPAVGTVKLSLQAIDPNTIQLLVKDDGQGINLDKLRQKAVEMGLTTADNAMNIPTKNLYALIFKSGVSTAEQQDEDAGRGVGMDIVKELIQNHQGKVGIQSQPNEFTQISATFAV